MRIGLLRTKVTIKEPTYTRNAYGEEVPTYNTIATARVRWEPQTSKELVIKETGATEETVTVTMRYYNRVTTKCKIVKDENEYNIVSVINPEDRNRELQLTVVRQG